MKHVLTALTLCMLSTTAYAGCETPELEFYVDVDEEHGWGSAVSQYADPSWKRNDDVSFGISFTIPLGKTNEHLCAAEAAKENNESITEFYEGLKKQAEARDKNADAKAQEQDNLEQKLEICKDFTVSTAPQSIKTFCGDLIE